MNKQAIISILLVMLIAIFGVSCSKEENQKEINLSTKVSGKYTGTISSSENTVETTYAIIDISGVDGATIHIDLMSEMMDTTFLLNLYENGDSIMVCLSGEEFNEMYGHHLDEDHHMMENENHMGWNHHLSEQHEPEDEHFGGFDQKHHSFHYRIVSENPEDAYYQFKGQKQ